MPASTRIREMLLADLALQRGLASPPDIAAALQLVWAEPDDRTVAGELSRITDLAPQVLEALGAEVDALLAEGAGLRAFGRRGELARSVHSAWVQGEVGTPEATAGTRLRALDDDRYVEFIPAGDGGMGVVYMARDTELNRLVAFKMVKPPDTDPRAGVPPTPLEIAAPEGGTEASQSFGQLRARFLQEAWVTGGLEHPGIVPVYELGETQAGVPFYTMRFVRGQRSLSDAIEAAKDAPVEERLRLLEPFLKLCDTVRYAHARGVVHRDLKPDNVALGKYGEVVLLDWGLAKIEGDKDPAFSLWRARVQEFRDAGDLRTVATALGTPGYMAPEAAYGRSEEVDTRSDVYSLGVILYEILTGRRLYEFKTFRDYLDQLARGPAPEVGEKAEGVPETLAQLCAACLDHERTTRLADVATLADAIRAWQAASVLEREIEGHIRDARAALDDAETAAADTRLSHVDRAAAALHQIGSKSEGHAEVESLEARAGALRQRGIREREKASGRKLLVRVGVAALALASIVGYVVASRFDSQLDRIGRLSDAKRVRDLKEREAAFTIRDVDIEASTSRWLADARAIVARREEHERALAALRERAVVQGPHWRFDDVTLEWQHQVLTDLVGEISALEAGLGERDSEARRFQMLSRRIDEAERVHADAWAVALREVGANAAYGGLALRPQRGLVPLGPDPATGLQEFAHVGSGSIPRREATGRIDGAPDAAIVFVLVPRGRFWMGSQSQDPDAPGFDPEAVTQAKAKYQHEREDPVREVSVEAFFVAKHECTQSQWDALTGGDRPSFFDSPEKGPRYPVEQLSWKDCSLWLPRHGLRLPAEVEWEYACRAGTKTMYWTGGAGTLGDGGWTAEDILRPSHDNENVLRGRPQDVGMTGGGRNGGERGRPNDFGLYDTLGNVWEFCSDVAAAYGRADTQVPGWRMIRGASWYEEATTARCAKRRGVREDYVCFHTGFRAARSIDP